MATESAEQNHERFSLFDSDFISYVLKVTGMIEDPFEIDLPQSPKTQQTSDDETNSSPSSKMSPDSATSTNQSSTTTCTTMDLSPGSSLDISPGSAHSVTEPTLDDLLQSTEVSSEMAERFKTLRDIAFHINILLFPEDKKTPVCKDRVTEAEKYLESMTKWLVAFRDAVEDHAGNVQFIMTSAPFTIGPPRASYWTCYKQRAELIVRYTKKPKQADRNLVRGFIRLFEDYVYIEALQSYRDPGTELQDRLCNLYSTLLACEKAYDDWVVGMKVVGDVYTKPLMQALMADRALQQAILGQQDEQNTAYLTADTPQSLPFRLPSVATNARLGRSAEAAKQSRRNRRQHTL